MTTPLSGITVNLLSGVVIIDSTITDVSGNYEFTDIQSASYTISAEGQGRTEVTNNIPLTLSTGVVTAVDIYFDAATLTSPCSSGPSMLVTVTGPVSGGTILWCGETWDLTNPGSESGIQKEVCPSGYLLDAPFSGVVSPYTVTGAVASARNSWVASGLALGREIQMQEFNSGTLVYDEFPPFYWKKRDASSAIQVQGLRDRIVWAEYTPLNPITVQTINSINLTSSPYAVYSSLGKISITPSLTNPNGNDHLLPSKFFGSVVISGITYEWEKGNGW